MKRFLILSLFVIPFIAACAAPPPVYPTPKPVVTPLSENHNLVLVKRKVTQVQGSGYFVIREWWKNPNTGFCYLFTDGSYQMNTDTDFPPIQECEIG